MNRSILIILIPALIVAAGYVIVLRPVSRAACVDELMSCGAIS